MPDHSAANAHALAREPITTEPKCVLIVANQTATSPALIAELQERTRRDAVRLHLVVPALNSRLRHWLSDSDQAVRLAQQRGEDARSVMAAHGVWVSVEVGDSVPIHAIADALAYFPADEILISTLGAHRSHWLERDLINRSRQRFGVAVAHVIAADPVALVAEKLPPAGRRLPTGGHGGVVCEQAHHEVVESRGVVRP